MTIVVSSNVTNVQVSDSAAARADRLLAEAAAAQAAGVVPTTTGITRVTSISYLRTITPDASKNILVTGYYSDGDGGGGLFFAATGGSAGTFVDNGGTIIVPNTGNGSTAWLRVGMTASTPTMFGWKGGPIQARWFGAKGDGTTDDTTAISNALTFLGGSGTLDFGEVGSFVVSSTLSINNAVGLNIIGSGAPWGTNSVPGVKIKWTGNSTSPIFKFNNSAIRTTCQNLAFYGGPVAIKYTRPDVSPSSNLIHENYIENCVFDGQTIASVVWGYELTETATAGIDDFDGLIIEKCYFGNCAIGILANPNNNSYNIQINESITGSGVSRPIVIRNVSDIVIRDSHPLRSDYANGYYAIDIDYGDRFLSLDNVYTESPLFIKSTNWLVDSGNHAVLKNCIVNSPDTDQTRIAIDLDLYAILLNVQATTNATPYLKRIMRFGSGYFALPILNATNNPITDTAGTGAGVDLNGTLYAAGSMLGSWTDVAYSSGNFGTKDTTTWTVDSGDQIAYRYMIIGKTMWIQFWIQSSSVSGSVDYLTLKIPNSKTSSFYSMSSVHLANGSNVGGYAKMDPSIYTNKIILMFGNGNAFATSSNNTVASGTICIEID